MKCYFRLNVYDPTEPSLVSERKRKIDEYENINRIDEEVEEEEETRDERRAKDIRKKIEILKLCFNISCVRVGYSVFSVQCALFGYNMLVYATFHSSFRLLSKNIFYGKLNSFP